MGNEPRKKNLSYSGYSTYVTCPKKYDYNYNHKIRPDTTPVHLIFGQAVDLALNEILLGKTPNEAMKFAEAVLLKILVENIEFDAASFDAELFTDESILSVREALASVGWKGDNPLALAPVLLEKRMFGETLSDNQDRALKLLVIHSLLEKVRLMIEAFIKYVQPRIQEVVSVQTYVKRGILDFKVKLHGVDGIVIGDNKTASRDYDRDSVKTSVQLAGYGAEKGAYIVFNKNVKKNRIKTCSVCGNDGSGKRHKTCDVETNKVRCGGEWNETVSPEIIPQIIIDDVPEHNRTMVEQAYADTEALIATGHFPRNLNNCGKQFGQPCPYIKLCWNNDSTGLKKD